MIKEIELVIFDMDGLMFDTERLSYKSWCLAFEANGYSLTKEVFELTLGVTYERTKEAFIEIYGEEFPFDDIVPLRNRISQELVEKHGIPIKNGLHELLVFLRRSDYKLAVATSASKLRANTFLTKAKVIDYFDCVVCGDEVKRSKPNAEIFLTACNRLDCNPKKVLVLEDSEVGIEAAYNAGMCPIMIPDIIEPSRTTKSMLYLQLDNLLEVIDILSV